MVVESTINYFDTLDCPATDLKTAYEVLSRGCEVKDRLKLDAVVCVFNQASWPPRPWRFTGNARSY